MKIITHIKTPRGVGVVTSESKTLIGDIMYEVFIRGKGLYIYFKSELK